MGQRQGDKSPVGKALVGQVGHPTSQMHPVVQVAA